MFCSNRRRIDAMVICDKSGKILATSDPPDLYGARFMDANCESCKFVGVDLRRSTLYGASFRNSDLSGACFALDQMGGAVSIFGADFSNAKLDGAHFSGAVHDETTVFPEAFDPHER
jgi:uncharacterized protein YjbI with pentapeptide repeats